MILIAYNAILLAWLELAKVTPPSFRFVMKVLSLLGKSANLYFTGPSVRAVERRA